MSRCFLIITQTYDKNVSNYFTAILFLEQSSLFHSKSFIIWNKQTISYAENSKANFSATLLLKEWCVLCSMCQLKPSMAMLSSQPWREYSRRKSVCRLFNEEMNWGKQKQNRPAFTEQKSKNVSSRQLCVITSVALQRVAKGFCVTRDRPKLSNVMWNYIEIKLAAWRGTGHHNVMRDLLFYKHVIRDLPIRFP